VLYQGALYAHFIDSDIEEYIHSLQKLLKIRDRINRLYPAHNDHSLPTSFLDPVLEAFYGIQKGAFSGDIIKDWGEPVVRYNLDDFAILTKGLNSPGVNLLD
jgi:hypothetical protein